MMKSYSRIIPFLAVVLVLVSCNKEDPNPLASEVAGMWWKLIEQKGTLPENFGGADYTRIGNAVFLGETGSGYGVTFFFNDDEADPIYVIGGESVAGLTYTTSVGGSIKLNFDKAYIEYADYYRNWTMTYSGGSITASDGKSGFTMDKASDAMTALIKEWDWAANGGLAPVTDLSTISANYTVSNGETITGTPAGNYKISIAAGATVTLKDVTIDGSGNYAGITCLGDATIILDGTNHVKGCSSDYPGIYVPQYKTLTILGTGSLTAIGNDSGAGIGGSSDADCGNIVIEGGTIAATGGKYAAGIGSGGYGSCGSITISGGTVTATGGDEAAGIGSSWGSCGNITITDGVTSVTATKGFDAYNSIGAGYHGSCGTVTIGGNVGAISKSPYTFPVITDLSTVDGNYTALNLETLTGTLAGNYKISIAAGATVTLKDMTIVGTDNSDYQWAGITCEGNATIILEGTNSVEGSSYYYPGIHVPKGSTLTIRGTGSLTSIGQGGGSGIGGIGVSDGNRSYCGNITIEGGIITARAGEYAAGIGGGKNCNCGNITITGGTITAYGGTKSAGIGSSMGSDCGNIRITDGVTKVTVYSGANYAIGPGINGSCGTVNIGGKSGGVAGAPYIYQP